MSELARANAREAAFREALGAYEADHSGNDNPKPCLCPLCVEARALLLGTSQAGGRSEGES